MAESVRLIGLHTYFYRVKVLYYFCITLRRRNSYQMKYL